MNRPILEPVACPPPRPTAHELLVRRYPAPTAPAAMPTPRQAGPHRMTLQEIVGRRAAAEVADRRLLRLHAIGDTGGLGNPGPQRAVAEAMACELRGPDPARRLFHLGDVVYPHGEPGGYPAQFDGGWAPYPAPIVGVPGNHDGECPPGPDGQPLHGFTRRFCSSGAASEPAARDPQTRPAQQQPHVHWSLRHELVTIIGVYSGVTDGGQIDEAQRRWLIGELAAAPRDAVLLLAMHHPVYSADVVHGSNLALGEVLDECFARARRAPDAVLAGHAHNYQRFSRSLDERSVPYLVAGSGGFPELHALGRGIPDLPASFTGLPGVTLDAHQHSAFGFLTVTAQPGRTRIDYSLVVRRRSVRFDSVTVTAISGRRGLRGRSAPRWLPTPIR
ncbi:MAG TPA: metallophosphoesterase [Solirubrobacteraceae bacterium]|nr:metallophosphoesterase [Solirubrobacteraceae bacterium]